MIKTISSATYIIHWKKRNGKSMFAVSLFWTHYDRIYSNFDIYRDWVCISQKISKFSDFEKIVFSPQQWIVIIDEAGFNFSYNSWKTAENNQIKEFEFLSGKANCSLCYIAQNYENIHPDGRRAWDYIFEVSKILRVWKHPLFNIERQTVEKVWENGIKLVFDRWFIVDLIKYNDEFWLSYNQFETSKLT